MASYLYWKIFHLIGMVSWMAGLFYLPRLFVYHAEARELPEAVQKPSSAAGILETVRRCLDDG